MRRTDNLFQLVKAMNRTDKRNFRLMTQITSGDKKYLRLFDAIDRQSVYDEDRLVKQFRNDPMVKQFSVSKNYLYNNILRSLVHFYQGKNQDLSPTQLQVVILVDKNLPLQAMKLLRKAKSRARQVEDFQELLRLLEAERRILMGNPDFRNLAGQIEELQKEERGAESCAANLSAYQHLMDRASMAAFRLRSARAGTERAEMEEVLAHPLLGSPECAMGFRARFLYWGIHARASTYFDDNQKVVSMCEAFRADIAASGKLAGLFEDAQVEMMVLTGESLVRLGQKDAFNALLVRIGRLPLTSEHARQARDREALRLRLHHLASRGMVPEGLEALRELEEMGSEGLEGFPLTAWMLIHYQAAWLHAQAGQAREAQRWIQALLDAPRTDLWEDLQCYARITDLLMHFELDNLDELEDNLKSTVRFIFKRSRMHRVERLVIRGIRMLIQAEEQDAKWEILRGMLADAREVSGDALDWPALRALHLPLFLTSKLRGESMADLLKEGYDPQKWAGYSGDL